MSLIFSLNMITCFAEFSCDACITHASVSAISESSLTAAIRRAVIVHTIVLLKKQRQNSLSLYHNSVTHLRPFRGHYKDFSFDFWISKSQYSETSPSGQLYSRDNSFQGAQNLVPEKCSHNLCIILLLLLKGHLYSGEGDTFSGSENLSLTSIQGTP